MIATLLLTLFPSIPTDISLSGAESLIADNPPPFPSGTIMCWEILCGPHNQVEQFIWICPGIWSQSQCNEGFQNAYAKWLNKHGHGIADEGRCGTL
jgi:hypothetical protein